MLSLVVHSRILFYIVGEVLEADFGRCWLLLWLVIGSYIYSWLFIGSDFGRLGCACFMCASWKNWFNKKVSGLWAHLRLLFEVTKNFEGTFVWGRDHFCGMYFWNSICLWSRFDSFSCLEKINLWKDSGKIAVVFCDWK